MVIEAERNLINICIYRLKEWAVRNLVHKHLHYIYALKDLINIHIYIQENLNGWTSRMFYLRETANLHKSSYLSSAKVPNIQ